jgi:Raf kinase inhibitor-like YbhB/YbcL family protein
MKATAFAFFAVLLALMSKGGTVIAGTPETPAGGVFYLKVLPAENEGFLDSTYGCKGENKSPALAWGNVPATAKTFSIVMRDLDYPSYRHWEISDIPFSYTGLPAGVPRDAQWLEGIKQSRNSAGWDGYAGPCPPAVHRYEFTIKALDAHGSVLDKASVVVRSNG